MPRIRLRTQILILQMVIVTASLAAGFGIIIHRTDTQTRTEFARRAQAISHGHIPPVPRASRAIDAPQAPNPWIAQT